METGESADQKQRPFLSRVTATFFPLSHFLRSAAPCVSLSTILQSLQLSAVDLKSLSFPNKVLQSLQLNAVDLQSLTFLGNILTSLHLSAVDLKSHISAHYTVVLTSCRRS